MFANKSFLITGGTGTFGSIMVRKLIKLNVKKIIIFSRDEDKQFHFRNELLQHEKKLKFIIGDIRDKLGVQNVFQNNQIDYVFHAAALKHVPTGELHTSEMIKTNIIGSENIILSSIKYGVKKIICLSTDKSVYPINAMGISKAMMEKISLHYSKILEDNKNSKTKIIVTRYGNVFSSRGSVVKVLNDCINNNKPLSITDPNMTRFIMSVKDAIDLVFIKKSKSIKLLDLFKYFLEFKKKKNYPIHTVGVRLGEKIHEILINKEEMPFIKRYKNYYIIKPFTKAKTFQNYFEKGYFTKLGKDIKEYNSYDSQRITKPELLKLFKDSDNI